MTRLLLGLVVVSAGCATVEVKPAGAPPSLPVQELQVVSQSLTEFHLKFSGKVEAGEPATVVKASWELVVDEKVVRSGEQPLGLAVTPGAQTDLALDQTTAYVSSADELKAMDARGGSLLCALRGKLFVKTATATVELPFARSREVRVPRLPHAKFQEFEAGRYSEDEAGVTFHVGVYNPNPFEVKLTHLKYAIAIAGKPVADGEVGKGDKISPSSTGVFDFEAKVSADTHGAEIKKLIKARQLPYEITGELAAELFTENFDFKGNLNLPASK